MEKLKIVGLFFFKVLYHLILKLIFREKLLNHAYGCDTLPFFSPYSYGGVLRNKFLILYKKMKRGNKITSDDYTLAKYGTLFPLSDDISKAQERSTITKTIFSFKS